MNDGIQLVFSLIPDNETSQNDSPEVHMTTLKKFYFIIAALGAVFLLETLLPISLF